MDIASVVKVIILRDGARVPCYMSPGASGADLFALPESDIELEPGDFAMVPTGIAVEVPEGLEGEIRPRSGLAAKYGVTLLNSPGTVDSDYRGEVFVVMINHGKSAFKIGRGDRIAQFVIKPSARVPFEEADELSDTHRDDRGFGSTGI